MEAAEKTSNGGDQWHAFGLSVAQMRVLDARPETANNSGMQR